MSAVIRYPYDTPKRLVAIRVAVCLAVAAAILCCARSNTFGIFVTAVGAGLVILAELMVLRRWMFRHRLELSDEAMLLPPKYAGGAWNAIWFEDVQRIESCPDHLAIFTAKGEFRLRRDWFCDVAQFDAVKESLHAKTAAASTTKTGRRSSRDLDRSLPLVVSQWVEPDVWSRYRTQQVRSQPLIERLGRVARVFAICMAFGLIAVLFLLPFTQPEVVREMAVGFIFQFFLILFGSLVLAWFYWMYSLFGFRQHEVIVRYDGIVLGGEKQPDYRYEYEDMRGWTVIEREYKGRTLHILLVQYPFSVMSIALPDIDVRREVEQILRERGVPHSDEIEPSWESD